MTNKKKSKIIWFTGMSGSGKTYYSNLIYQKLQTYKMQINLIDGDVIRDKYKIPMGFEYDEICSNNRNIARICKNEYKKYETNLFFCSFILIYFYFHLFLYFS